MVEELLDEELELVNGGWISSAELYNNRDKYLQHDFTLSRCGCFFGIHEDVLRVKLLDVYKDSEGNIRIVYRILKNLSDDWSTVSLEGTPGQQCWEYYNKTSPFFLR